MKLRSFSAAQVLLMVAACSCSSDGEEGSPERSWVTYTHLESAHETRLLVSKTGHFELIVFSNGEAENNEGALTAEETAALDELLSDARFSIYRLDEPANCEKNNSNSVVTVSRVNAGSGQRACLDTLQLEHEESQELVSEMEKLTQKVAE